MLKNFNGWEIVIVLVIILLLFGARKLPDLARSIGASAKEFRKGLAEGVEHHLAGGDGRDGVDDALAGQILESRADLDEIVAAVVRHAFIGGHPQRLLRYFDRPTRMDGQVYRNSRRPLKTTITVTDFDEGYRIRHWLQSNSVKLYNEGNVLRVETTVNDPGAFRGYRRKEGAPKEKAKLPAGWRTTG